MPLAHAVLALGFAQRVRLSRSLVRAVIAARGVKQTMLLFERATQRSPSVPLIPRIACNTKGLDPPKV